jgi:hypothetical protein
MAKFAHKHNLPVTRLVHINMGDWKDGKDLIIHLTKDISYDITTKANTSFWHTNCGKNMDWADADPRQHTVDEAVKGNRGVKFCPRCGTQEDFLKAFEAMKKFDVDRDNKEKAERIAQQAEDSLKFQTMCEVFGTEVAEVLENRLVLECERENEVFYTIVKNGVRYKITMKISEDK